MTPFNLTGKKVLIFGAGGGIGVAVTRGFAAAGAQLTLFDVQSLVALAKEVGGVVVGGDINDPGQVTAAVEQSGQLDVVVNLAYASVLSPIVETTLRDFEMTMDTCLRGCFLISQSAGRALIKQGTGGSVIHFTSIAGAVALGRGTGAYAAAKAGINAIVRETAVEWGAHKIRVNGINTGWINFSETGIPIRLTPELARGAPILENSGMKKTTLLGRPSSVEECARTVLFLATDDSSYITGAMLPVDGGRSALTPGTFG